MSLGLSPQAHAAEHNRQCEKLVGKRHGNRKLAKFVKGHKGRGSHFVLVCKKGHEATIDARRVLKGLQAPACNACGGFTQTGKLDDAWQRCDICGGLVWREAGHVAHDCRVPHIDDWAGARTGHPAAGW